MRDHTRNFVDLTCCAPDCASPASPISSRAAPLCETHAIRAYRAMGEHMRSKLEIENDERYEIVWTDAYPTTRCTNLGCDGKVRRAYRRLRGTASVDREPVYEYKCSNSLCRMTLTRDAWETMHVRTDSRLEYVVYYVLFGDRIKIGTTSNIAKRLMALPCDELLATEPGGVTLERSRHLQFEQYRLTGEWFSRSPKLLHHIDSLKAG